MPMKSESKMVKGKKDKKKKLKQKQKQKQIVKTTVKVNVQSSGGSGGGGSSIPQPFMDKSGENIRLQNLIQQLTKQPIQVPVQIPAQIPVQFQAPAKVPAKKNERITVIKQPAESIASFEEQSREMEEAMIRAKLKALDAKSDTPNFVAENYEPNDDDLTVENVFNQPNRNNNSIAESIFSSNLRKSDPVTFINNDNEIQSVISGISSYNGGGISEHSKESDIGFLKAGLEILKTSQSLNKYIDEQKNSYPTFEGEEQSSVASSAKSSIPPSKISGNLFKQIDDLSEQIRKETIKEKTLMGEAGKKQFDYVNSLIDKKIELQAQTSKPPSAFQESMSKKYVKLPVIQRAGESSLQKPNFEGEADAPYGRFKNGKPRKSPSP